MPGELEQHLQLRARSSPASSGPGFESTLLERMGEAGGLYPGLTKRQERPVLRRVVVAAHEVAPSPSPAVTVSRPQRIL